MMPNGVPSIRPRERGFWANGTFPDRTVSSRSFVCHEEFLHLIISQNLSLNNHPPSTRMKIKKMQSSIQIGSSQILTKAIKSNGSLDLDLDTSTSNLHHIQFQRTNNITNI